MGSNKQGGAGLCACVFMQSQSKARELTSTCEGE